MKRFTTVVSISLALAASCGYSDKGSSSTTTGGGGNTSTTSGGTSGSTTSSGSTGSTGTTGTSSSGSTGTSGDVDGGADCHTLVVTWDPPTPGEQGLYLKGELDENGISDGWRAWGQPMNGTLTYSWEVCRTPASIRWEGFDTAGGQTNWSCVAVDASGSNFTFRGNPRCTWDGHDVAATKKPNGLGGCEVLCDGLQ